LIGRAEKIKKLGAKQKKSIPSSFIKEFEENKQDFSENKNIDE
jgi:ribosomal protein S17E